MVMINLTPSDPNVDFELDSRRHLRPAPDDSWFVLNPASDFRPPREECLVKFDGKEQLASDFVKQVREDRKKLRDLSCALERQHNLSTTLQGQVENLFVSNQTLDSENCQLRRELQELKNKYSNIDGRSLEDVATEVQQVRNENHMLKYDLRQAKVALSNARSNAGEQVTYYQGKVDERKREIVQLQEALTRKNQRIREARGMLDAADPYDH